MKECLLSTKATKALLSNVDINVYELKRMLVLLVEKFAAADFSLQGHK